MRARFAGPSAVVLCLLASSARAQPTDPGPGAPPVVPQALEDQRQAAVVAERFLTALLEKDAAMLAGLGTDPFTFDGRPVAGRQDIMRRWKTYLEGPAGKLGDQEGLKLSVFDHAKAVELFGAPPAKLTHLRLEKCMFAALTFEKRRGFLMILAPNPAAPRRDPRGRPEDAYRDPDGEGPAPWIVTALTE